MVEFREFGELEDDEENLKVQIQEQLLTKEEGAQFLRELHAEYFGKHDNSETNLRLSDSECQEREIPRYWEIRSSEKLNETLNKHWKIIVTPGFNNRYRQAVTYCSLLEALDNQTIQQTSKVYGEFAESYGIHRITVTRWATGKKKPCLINQLESLRKVNLLETNNNESIELSIFDGKRSPHVIFSHTNSSLTITDKDSLEESGYQFRPAFVDDRQYLWIHNKDSLFSAFGNQYFYFNRMQDLNRIFEEAASQLELDSMVAAVHHIYQLSKQFTVIDRELITKDNPRIPGSSLHLLCDIAGISINQLEGRIEKISGANGHGGIEKPRFPVADNLEVLIARLIGIAVSDCHLPKSGTLSLYEGSLDRIDRVKKLLDNFGVTYSTDSLVKRQGDYAFYIASPMLSALEHWGIPTGDRTIRNYGLPNDAICWSNLAIQGYLREMLAQEGNVDKNGVINWARSHALYDGKKGNEYNFQSKLSQSALKFLRESKKMRRHKGMVSEASIPIGKLETMSLDKGENDKGVADEILSVVFEYRNRLIDNEKRLVERLGISVKLDPVRVSYFSKSDRISVRWQARIPGKSSKIRSALLISPNHELKELLIQEWLDKQSIDDVVRSKKRIESDGMSGLL